VQFALGSTQLPETLENCWLPSEPATYPDQFALVATDTSVLAAPAEGARPRATTPTSAAALLARRFRVVRLIVRVFIKSPLLGRVDWLHDHCCSRQ
jgi:hypothetical protein